MFFENSDDSQKGEVRISAPEKEKDPNEKSKLEEEAESKLLGSSSSKSKTSKTSDITVEDIHRQNERIIELLEQINGDSSSDSKQNSQDLGGVGADGLL